MVLRAPAGLTTAHVLIVGALVGACASSVGPPTAGDAIDVRSDSIDSRPEVAERDVPPFDVPQDADASRDSTFDTPTDVLADAPPDSPLDTPFDVPPDVPVDAPRDVPPDIVLPITPVEIAAGYYHTCARRIDGSVRCWGHLTGVAPRTVVGLTLVTSLTGGTWHTCGLRFDGTVRCWGRNDGWQIGSGSMDESVRDPAVVSGLSGVTQITADWAHSCARLGDGALRCWGRNLDGQLGDGTVVAARATPVVVLGVRNALQVEAGARQTCALLTDGTVLCWGRNEYGQLGLGFVLDEIIAAAPVQGVRTATQIAVGSYHACARLRDGTVQCWGHNDAGQTGDGTMDTMRPAPATVPGLAGVVEVSCGERHTCARMIDGTVRCWGSNADGQIGDGTMGGERRAPVPVPTLRNVAHVTAGYSHTCASLSDHTVWCWGSNAYGQIGDGTMDDRLSPTLVAGM